MAAGVEGELDLQFGAVAVALLRRGRRVGLGPQGGVEVVDVGCVVFVVVEVLDLFRDAWFEGLAEVGGGC